MEILKGQVNMLVFQHNFEDTQKFTYSLSGKLILSSHETICSITTCSDSLSSAAVRARMRDCVAATLKLSSAQARMHMLWRTVCARSTSLTLTCLCVITEGSVPNQLLSILKRLLQGQSLNHMTG